MLHFERVTVGNIHYLMQEITFNAAIKIARIPERHIEQRLTVFLQSALQDEQRPFEMTVQERYCLLLHYLKEQSGTLLAIDQDLDEFLLPPGQPWQTEVVTEGITVRQLNGIEAETLEKNCTNLADWIAGSMATQIYDPATDMPQLTSSDMDSQARQARFVERIEYFKTLPLSEFERYYKIYQAGLASMQSLVKTSLDEQGIVLIRGADDAPFRFCPSSIFYGVAGQLDQYFNQPGATVEF